MNNANAIRTPQAIPCPEATDLDPDYHPCAKTNRRAVLLITILGSSLAFMDGSIVNVALPTLQRVFHAGASSVQWVVQSYALFSAALLLFSGALGDQFGRKKIFVLGVAFFTVSSLGCAVASSLSSLADVGDPCQGIGASLLIPQSLAISIGGLSCRGSCLSHWHVVCVDQRLRSLGAGGRRLVDPDSQLALGVCNQPAGRRLDIPSPAEASRERIGFQSRKSSRKLDLTGDGSQYVRAGSRGLFVIVRFRIRVEQSAESAEPSWLGLLLIVAFLATQSRRENALMPLSLFKNQRFLSVNILTFLLVRSVGRDFLHGSVLRNSNQTSGCRRDRCCFFAMHRSDVSFCQPHRTNECPLRRAAIPDHRGDCFGSGHRAFRNLREAAGIRNFSTAGNGRPRSGDHDRARAAHECRYDFGS